MKKNFTAEETYLSVFCNNKNVYTQYIKIDIQRLHLASDIKQFLEHWKELEVVQWRKDIVLLGFGQKPYGSPTLWTPTMLLMLLLIFLFYCNSIFWDIFFIQNGIPRFRIFRHYADPPFLHSIFQLYNSRYRISQLAHFANWAALFSIIIIIIIVVIMIIIIIIIAGGKRSTQS